jgi:hypothetical protein
MSLHQRTPITEQGVALSLVTRVGQCARNKLFFIVQISFWFLCIQKTNLLLLPVPVTQETALPRIIFFSAKQSNNITDNFLRSSAIISCVFLRLVEFKQTLMSQLFLCSL